MALDRFERPGASLALLDGVGGAAAELAFFRASPARLICLTATSRLYVVAETGPLYRGAGAPKKDMCALTPAPSSIMNSG